MWEGKETHIHKRREGKRWKLTIKMFRDFSPASFVSEHMTNVSVRGRDPLFHQSFSLPVFQSLSMSVIMNVNFIFKDAFSLNILHVSSASRTELSCWGLENGKALGLTFLTAKSPQLRFSHLPTRSLPYATGWGFRLKPQTWNFCWLSVPLTFIYGCGSGSVRRTRTA